MNLFYRNLLAFLFFHSLSLSGNEKIDPAIDLNKSDYIPVFVRMSDQLIRGAGEYERLSHLYSVNSRSENHQQVLFKLQKKASDSWEEVSGKSEEPSQAGQASQSSEILDRKWIFLSRKEFCHKRTRWAFENLLYLSRPIFQTISSFFCPKAERISSHESR